MKYLLDTNIIVDHLRGKTPIPKVLFSSDVAISVITFGELLYGAHKSQNTKHALAMVYQLIKTLRLSIVPISTEAIVAFAQIKAVLERKGERLEDFDILIAATAIAYSMTLVTRNTKHFSRVDKLRLL